MRLRLLVALVLALASSPSCSLSLLTSRPSCSQSLSLCKGNISNRSPLQGPDESRRPQRVATWNLHSLQASTTSSIDFKDSEEPSFVLSREEKTAIRTKLSKQFFAIAAPAFIQLTAEPLASLVDTAYLGRLGPEVLGGAGKLVAWFRELEEMHSNISVLPIYCVCLCLLIFLCR